MENCFKKRNDSLNLRNKSLRVVPTIKDADKIVRIDCKKNDIEDAIGLSKCVSATWADVSHNKITNMEFVTCMKHLTVLNLGNNKITDITAVSNLTNLKALILNNNSISEVSSLERLGNLSTLILSHNMLTDIDVTPLNGLTKLQLSHNEIKSFPCIKFNSKLRHLYLNDNKIKAITEDCFSDNRLELLNLGKNQIKKLKYIQVLSLITSITNLTLMGNPVTENLDNYRESVLELFSNLNILDFKPVSEEHKSKSKKKKRKEISENTESPSGSPAKKIKKDETKEELQSETMQPSGTKVQDKLSKKQTKKKNIEDATGDKTETNTSDDELEKTEKIHCEAAKGNSETKNQEVVKVGDSHNQHTKSAKKKSKKHKDVPRSKDRSGVVAIKEITKKKHKHSKNKSSDEVVDVFSVFSTDVGTGTTSSW